jgi:enolase
MAFSQGSTLASYIGSLSKTVARMPSPLVAVFSGGIHGREMPLQQIMLGVAQARFLDAARVTMDIYDSIEADARRDRILNGYSPSSGMLLTQCDCRRLLDMLGETISRLGYMHCCGIGIDVAAEHLKLSSGEYQFGSRLMTADSLLKEYLSLCENYPMVYIEDPFDSSDDGAWRELRRCIDPAVAVIGDDLFATNADLVDSTLASGILLKMNQIGTLTGTLHAASKASQQGMSLCVSHRSFETEDTAMCDLAVSLGAKYIKIGGPRRGDRTEKYNQLLRLEELLDDAFGERGVARVDGDRVAAEMMHG